MAKETGTLYLVATPIGNLEDISLRAIRILNSVHCIAAEDTRRTLTLLRHLEISTRLISYHEHSGEAKLRKLVDLLLAGEDIALVSDAGMPVISDPGEPLVREAVEAGIPVVCIPGACAAVCAVAVAALPADRFVFEGFLPRGKERRTALERALGHDCATVLYESPHHLTRTLADLAQQDSNRRIAICRELTKVYEEVLRMTVGEAVEWFQEREPRGEFVLVLEGICQEKPEACDEEILAELARRRQAGESNKNAVEHTAQMFGVGKNRVYQLSVER